MGMSTWIKGFKPADETYRRMKAVLDACATVNVEPPEEVKAYFGSEWEEGADAHGVEVNLNPPYGPPADGVTKWKAEMKSGYEVDLRKLDPAIKVLRFYNSH